MTDDAKALADAFDLTAATAAFADDPFPTYAALLAHAPVKRFADGFLRQIVLARALLQQIETLGDDEVECHRATFARLVTREIEQVVDDAVAEVVLQAEVQIQSNLLKFENYF